MVVDEPTAPRAALDSRTAPRVLVVDDDESVLLTVQGVLELDHYEVLAVSSGARALELVRSEPFDLVLTDLRLEDVDGIEILRALHTKSPDAVGVMLTGYASLETALGALRQGAYDYLVKPCDVLELRTTVGRGLERSRLASQLRDRVAELERANATIQALNAELEQRVQSATAALRDQVSTRDEFIATVSHDLKSPLTFIKGIAHLRRRRAPDTPQTAPLLDALQQIEGCAGRMADQLDELVDASLLEAGEALELRRAPTDLVALARQSVAEHQHTTDRHALRVLTSEPAIVGTWDELRLARVLDNLLNNAIKFSPRGGTIDVCIELDADASVAMLGVADRGEGIPEADLPHIFERFRRGENVQGRIPGSGIGLFGVRRIVELHNGTIEVESHLGQGTLFTIRLPLDSSS
ncbi:MAG: response regulator [Chloroflexi bacterium]|nr:response regulator [Chloroflexota bacterium]